MSRTSQSLSAIKKYLVGTIYQTHKTNATTSLYGGLGVIVMQDLNWRMRLNKRFELESMGAPPTDTRLQTPLGNRICPTAYPKKSTFPKKIYIYTISCISGDWAGTPDFVFD